VTDIRYKSTSAYHRTPIEGRFLMHYVHRPVPAHPNGQIVVVPYEWVNRPDIMALDLYGDDDLWMAIPLRNGLQDPVFDITYERVLIVPPRDLVLRIFK